MAGIGKALRGVGKAYKDYVKYEKGKVRKGPLGYVDMVEKDILTTHGPGSKWVKEPNPIPTMKKIVKTAVAAPIAIVGTSAVVKKVKKKLKERKDKKHQRKGPSGKK